MASQGPTLVTTANNQDTGGTAWANDGAIVADDGSLSSNLTPAFTSSDYLMGDYEGGGFFTVPVDATIDGVMVEINDATYSDTAYVCLTDDGANPVGFQEAVLGGAGWVSHGGPTYKWGLGATLTPAMVNSSAFGILLQNVAELASSASMSVDAVRITVYYTEAGAAPQKLRPVADAGGSWTAVGAATTWEATDETIANDADYAESPDNTVSATEEKFELGPGSKPDLGSTITLRVRLGKNVALGDTIQQTVKLYAADGTTVLYTSANFTEDTPATKVLVIPSATVDAIASSEFTNGLIVGVVSVKL